MTTDPGVRDMLSFLLARDTYHQRQWMAAIEELEKDGLEMAVVPSGFPPELERSENNSQFWNFSKGDESSEGAWMKINVDGKPIDYISDPVPMGDAPTLGIGHPKIYDTLGAPATVGPPNGRP